MSIGSLTDGYYSITSFCTLFYIRASAADLKSTIDEALTDSMLLASVYWMRFAVFDGSSLLYCPLFRMLDRCVSIFCLMLIAILARIGLPSFSRRSKLPLSLFFMRSSSFFWRFILLLMSSLNLMVICLACFFFLSDFFYSIYFFCSIFIVMPLFSFWSELSLTGAWPCESFSAGWPWSCAGGDDLIFLKTSMMVILRSVFSGSSCCLGFSRLLLNMFIRPPLSVPSRPLTSLSIASLERLSLDEPSLGGVCIVWERDFSRRRFKGIDCLKNAILPEHSLLSLP